MVDLREAFVGALVGQIAQEGAKETIKIARAGLQPSPIAYASEPQQGNSIIPLAVGVVILFLLLRNKRNKNEK